MANGRLRKAAESQAVALTGLYLHAMVFAVVTGLVLVADAVDQPSWGVLWPGLGWAVGLMMHALAVFGQGRWLARAGKNP